MKTLTLKTPRLHTLYTKHTKHIPNHQGFTIVELLIVIVIIGILAAISIVTYNTIQNKARDAATIADIESIDRVVTIAEIEDSALPSSPEAYKEKGLGSIVDKMVVESEVSRGQYGVSSMNSDELSLYYWDYNEGRWTGVTWYLDDLDSDDGVSRENLYLYQYRNCTEYKLFDCEPDYPD